MSLFISDSFVRDIDAMQLGNSERSSQMNAASSAMIDLVGHHSFVS